MRVRPDGRGRLEDVAERQDGVVSVAAGASTPAISRRQIWRRRRSGPLPTVPARRRADRRRAADVAAGGADRVDRRRRAGRSCRTPARPGCYGVELPRARPPPVGAGRPVHRGRRAARAPRPHGRRARTPVRHVGRRATSRSATAWRSRRPLRLVIDLSSRLGVDGTGRLVDELLRRRLLDHPCAARAGRRRCGRRRAARCAVLRIVRRRPRRRLRRRRVDARGADPTGHPAQGLPGAGRPALGA